MADHATPWEHETSPVEEPRVSRVPTGLGAEPLNIVILGASFAGLACAHHFLDHTINRLRIASTSPNYRLVIVNPSTHLYWNIAAPRALASPDLIKQEDLFIPIEPAFHRHRAHNLSIVQGEAIALDPSARTITVELIGSTAQKRASQISKRSSRQIRPVSMVSPSAKVQTIAYHAVIMATGSSAHSPLLGLQGTHLNTIGELNTFHARLAAAKSIVVCGGGCSGVETAGQLATYLNYDYHWPIRKRSKQAKRIVLITGANLCLPLHKPKISSKAEKMLRNLSVEIIHGVRLIAAKEGFNSAGQTKIELSDNTSLITDMFVPCTGVAPNSAYVPQEMRDAKGYIRTNRSTLRVDHLLAGVHTYAIGDVASYSRNCITDVYAAVPILMHNLLNDLLAHEYQLASPYGGDLDKIRELEDKIYFRQSAVDQLCPISRFGGVGTMMDVVLPKFMVHLLKGRDYRLRRVKKAVEEGRNPYPRRGKYG